MITNLSRFRRISVFFGILLLIGSGVTAVFAHAAVITKSIPANGEVLAESPEQVVVWFAEELQSPESTLAVYDLTGTKFGEGGVDLTDPEHASMIADVPELPDGSYIVQYSVLLLDGDPTEGAFAFAIGEGQDVAPLPEEDLNATEANSSSRVMLFLGGGIAATAVIIILLLVLIRRGSPQNQA